MKNAGIGELTKEILSRVDETLDEYTRGGRARHVATRKLSNRMEMTSLGNLDETGPVQDDVSHPARDEAR